MTTADQISALTAWDTPALSNALDALQLRSFAVGRAHPTSASPACSRCAASATDRRRSERHQATSNVVPIAMPVIHSGTGS